MAKETMYVIQPSFAGGEISREVASRIDFDKYQNALLSATNCYIRPYGSVYRRGGSFYIGSAKYADKKTILQAFHDPDGDALLEIGDRYIRIWRDDIYTGIELKTPYVEEDLVHLRFCQSADVMYIASGTHPVMTLSRYGELDFCLSEMKIMHPYFDASLSDTVNRQVSNFYQNKPGTYEWECKESGDYEIIVAGAGGGASGPYMLIDYGEKKRTYYEDSHTAAGGSGELVKKIVYFNKGEVVSIKVGRGGAGGKEMDKHNLPGAAPVKVERVLLSPHIQPKVEAAGVFQEADVEGMGTITISITICPEPPMVEAVKAALVHKRGKTGLYLYAISGMSGSRVIKNRADLLLLPPVKSFLVRIWWGREFV